MVILDTVLVITIHEEVILPHEIQGLSIDRPLDSTLERVHNRINYGMITSPFEVAAAYAVCIAKGHCFNDANKRTAINTMDVCLYLNGIEIDYDTEEVGDLMRAIADSGDEPDSEIENLTEWLIRKYNDQYSNEEHSRIKLKK